LTSKRYSYGDVTVKGGAGDDLLWTNAGNDVLDGGVGDDELAGGAGNDAYLHDTNGGDDLITETAGEDTVRFGAGIAARDVAVGRHGNDLVLSARGNGSVTVKDWFRDGAYRLEKVEFANGTSWAEAELSMRANAAGLEHDGGKTDHEGAGRPGGSRDADRPRDGDDRSKDAFHPAAAETPSEDAADVIAALLAKQPIYDFSALADYLSKNYDDGAGRPLSVADVERQWATLQRFTAGLASVDPYAAEAAHGHGYADDFLRVAASVVGWGFDGSTGSIPALGGLKGLAGLTEGFRRLA
jgi:Ca2+-binding RTX toxin-like protein